MSKLLSGVSYLPVFQQADVGSGGADNSAPPPAPPSPTAEEAGPKIDPAALINVKHPITVNEEVTFGFRKDKLGNKRQPIKLILPMPTTEGIVQALQDEKQLEYILDVLKDQIKAAARAQISDEEKPVNKQSELDINKLTIEFLANQPKAERTGGGISKEVWEAFSEDYIKVMPAVSGRTADQVGNAARLLLGKLQQVKTNKPVLTFLKQQLALYATNTENLEEFADCVDFLDKKAETFLNMDDASLLANL
jgi:hypothetical protein